MTTTLPYMPPLRLESNGKSVTPTRQIDQGGHGIIYHFAESKRLVVKLYKNPTPEDAAKLEAMLDNPPTDPTKAQGHISIAWPVDRVIDARGICVGYVMPYISKQRSKPTFRRRVDRKKDFP